MLDRIALAGLLAAACGPGKPPAEADPPRAKVLHVAVESVPIDPDAEPPVSEVFLILTDETGAARREEVGQVTGSCADVSATARAEPMAPILALDCWHAGAGVRLRFVARGGAINVLRAEVDESGGEPSYDAVGHIAIPEGAAIKTDHDHAAPTPGGGDDPR